jgi:hypothetical protein
VVVTIVAVGAVAVFGVGMIWYLFARGPRATTVSRADFDAEYDQLVAKGEAVDADRDTAWRDFNGWQVENERERLSWEEAPDE